MIGKIGRFGSNFLGALQYVYFGIKANRTRDLTSLRGELVFAQSINLTLISDTRLRGGATNRLNIEQMAEAMQTSASFNNRLRKPVWHQSFAFPPGEQPSNAVLVSICEGFVRAFGLADNQVLVFRHRDKNHDHIHIIANRVNHMGRTTALDSQNYRRTAQFCRLMEARHELIPAPHLISEELDGKLRLANTSATNRLRPTAERTPCETDKLLAAIIESKGVATDMPTFIEQLRERGYAAVTSERIGPDRKRWVGIVYGKTFAGGTERWVSGSTLGSAFTHRELSTFFEQKAVALARLSSTTPMNTMAAEAVEISRQDQAEKKKSDEVRLRFKP